MISTWKKQLEKQLKPKRYEHVLRVAKMAVTLAKNWNVDGENAEIAGLLHDCAKCIDDDEKIALCMEYGLVINDVERLNPDLLHAKAGRVLAEYKFGVQNEDILNAIQYHTTGRPNMSALEQIIFVSDYIEPGRNHSDKLPMLRELAFHNMEKTVAIILSDTLEYLKCTKEIKAKAIDPMTQKSFDYYKKYL